MQLPASLATAASPALTLYRDVSLGHWSHVNVRWRTCPLAQTAALVPPGGRVLEIGCGRGLLCTHLALASSEREVVGVDIDAHKLEVARRVLPEARRQGARLDFHIAAPGDVPEGRWDAILIVDVLYLMPLEQQRRLLARCAARLAPGGVLMVKEMATTPGWKYRWNYLQETLVVRLLGWTRGAERMSFAAPATLAAWMADAGLLVEQHAMDRGYLHAHHLVMGRRPHGGAVG